MLRIFFVIFTLTLFVSSAFAGSELHWQYGSLARPNFAGGGSESTTTFTYQYAGEWKYGNIYTFTDFSLSGNDDAFQNSDLYHEFDVRFSASKITGRSISFGPITDVGIYMAVNYGKDPKVLKFLPGVTMSLDIPSFDYFNVDVMKYIDANSGVRHGGAPKESDTWTMSTSWQISFKIGQKDFNVQGFAEYLASRTDEFGNHQPSWILIQPQIRWEINNHWAVGTELSYWRNKLGDPRTNEKAFQFLAVLKF